MKDKGVLGMEGPELVYWLVREIPGPPEQTQLNISLCHWMLAVLHSQVMVMVILTGVVGNGSSSFSVDSRPSYQE